MEKDGEDQLDSKSQQLLSSESSQWKSLYHQHDKSMKMQMAWACSQTRCVIARRSTRQADWETYERQKETTADEQHMRGIRNSKETSWRQMYVMCLTDGSHWPATTAEYQKKKNVQLKFGYLCPQLAIFTKLGMWVHIPDMFLSFEFQEDQTKLWELWGSKFYFYHWKGRSVIQQLVAITQAMIFLIWKINDKAIVCNLVMIPSWICSTAQWGTWFCWLL